MTHLEVICKGHVVERNGACRGCKTDGYNVNCPDYKPLKIGYFEVTKEEKEKAQEIDDNFLCSEMSANYDMIRGAR